MRRQRGRVGVVPGLLLLHLRRRESRRAPELPRAVLVLAGLLLLVLGLLSWAAAWVWAIG